MKGQQRLLYLLPACILVFAFFLFPLAYLSYISFFEWDGLGPKTFVGFENFEYVFSDPIFRTAVKNTIVWLLSALLLHIPFGLCWHFAESKTKRVEGISGNVFYT